MLTTCLFPEAELPHHQACLEHDCPTKLAGAGNAIVEYDWYLFDMGFVLLGSPGSFDVKAVTVR